ncbi:SOS response-associated peptidase [Enterococcus gilvus]|nr:SOS response-associated peptidase family protein [Enterococcus gilvus]
MCGRYLFDPMTGELDEYWKIIRNVAEKQKQYGDKEIATGDVFPSNNVVTLGANQKRRIVPGITKWGFEGFKKGQLLINARAETVEEKKTFRNSFQNHRCIFPMTGFYEWNTNKEKFLFIGESETLYVAGFYRLHEGIAESIIMTTEPDDVVSKIHDRMPLIIDKKDMEKWILDLDFAKEYLENNKSIVESKKVS